MMLNSKGKTCSKCRIEKELCDFYHNSKTKDNKGSYCKTCAKQIKKEHYHANKEQALMYRKGWRENNKQKDKESYQRWKHKNPDSYEKSWRTYNAKVRIKLLSKINSELKCQNCGCDKIELLEINHILGGGLKEVKRNNSKFYKSILDGSRQIDDLNLLCKICNIIHYVNLKFNIKHHNIIWNNHD